MKIITKYKTTELIKIASRRGGYIVCRDDREASRIAYVANEMSMPVNFPITFIEFIQQEYRGRNIKEFYIDDVSAFFACMTTVPVFAISEGELEHD